MNPNSRVPIIAASTTPALATAIHSALKATLATAPTAVIPHSTLTTSSTRAPDRFSSVPRRWCRWPRSVT